MFCAYCINKWTYKKQVKTCPMCRKIVHFHQVVKHYEMDNFINKMFEELRGEYLVRREKAKETRHAEMLMELKKRETAERNQQFFDILTSWEQTNQRLREQEAQEGRDGPTGTQTGSGNRDGN